MLHAMLSLQRPYEMYSAELHKLLVCQEGVRPTIFQDWPAALQDVLRDGWAILSAERPTMQDVCKRLQTMLTEIDLLRENTNLTESIQPQPSSIAGNDDKPPQLVATPSNSSSTPRDEDTTSYDSIASFIESWFDGLCASDTNKRQNKSVFRTLEAHLVADTAAGGQHMMRHSQSAYNGGNKWNVPDRDYQNQFARHMRSSYL